MGSSFRPKAEVPVERPSLPRELGKPGFLSRLVTTRKIKDFLVAREGIEPPTRGFSEGGALI
jgi:hypothetical protein